MKPGVKMTRDDVVKVMRNIKALTGLDVLVGVPSDKADRQDDTPINNAALAYIHTFGATIKVPERESTVGRRNGRFASAKKATTTTTHTVPAHEIVIPPRPFLEPGIKAAEPRTVPQLKKAAQAALSNDMGGATRHLNIAGLNAQNEVRGVINDGLSPALAESTLRKRRARGRTGDKPLEDTGELRNSITYVVRKK